MNTDEFLLSKLVSDVLDDPSILNIQEKTLFESEVEYKSFITKLTTIQELKKLIKLGLYNHGLYVEWSQETENTSTIPKVCFFEISICDDKIQLRYVCEIIAHLLMDSSGFIYQMRSKCQDDTYFIDYQNVEQRIKQLTKGSYLP